MSIPDEPDKAEFDAALNQELDNLVQELETSPEFLHPDPADEDSVPHPVVLAEIEHHADRFIEKIDDNLPPRHDDMLASLAKQLDETNSIHYAGLFPSVLTGELDQALEWFRVGVINRLDPDHRWTDKVIRSGKIGWRATVSILHYCLYRFTDKMSGNCIEYLADQSIPARVRRWLSNTIPHHEHDEETFYRAVRANLLNPGNDWADFSIHLEMLLDQEADQNNEHLVSLFTDDEMLLVCMDESYTGKRKQSALIILDALVPAFGGIQGVARKLAPDIQGGDINKVLLQLGRTADRMSVRLWAYDNLVLPADHDDIYTELLGLLGSQPYCLAAIAAQILARDPGHCISQVTALANNRHLPEQSRLYAISCLAQQAIDVTVLLDSIPGNRIELPTFISGQLRQTLLRECSLLDPLETDVRWQIEYFRLPSDESEYDYASLVQSVARSCNKRKILDTAELEDIIEPDYEVPTVIHLYNDPDYEHNDSDINLDDDSVDEQDEPDRFGGEGMAIELAFSPVAPFITPYASLALFEISLDSNHHNESTENTSELIREWKDFFQQKNTRRKLAAIRKITDPLGLVWLEPEVLEYRFEGIYGNDNSDDGTFTVAELLFPAY